MSSVIMARNCAMSARSQAACRLTKLVREASRKPATSNPCGTPQEGVPGRLDPSSLPERSASANRLASNDMDCRSHGRADASLPTFWGLYSRTDEPLAWPAPAPCNASGLLVETSRVCRLRITQAATATPLSTISPINNTLANTSPRPSVDANHANPRPAAKPPSTPVQALGCAAAAPLDAASAGEAAGACGDVAACPAAGGCCATWPDCLPTDSPPPNRLAAMDGCATSASPHINNDTSHFMICPLSTHLFWPDRRAIRRSPQHLVPTCSATTPPVRLCTSTCPKPAVFMICFSSSCAGCMRIDSAR